MEFQIYLKCVIAGILGIIAHIVFLKLPAVKKRSLAANKPFSVAEYFKDDWLAILGSFLTVVICVYLLDEIIGYNPSFFRYVKYGFLFIGYTGSSVLIGILGKADPKILTKVDKATNELDDIKKGDRL